MKTAPVPRPPKDPVEPDEMLHTAETCCPPFTKTLCGLPLDGCADDALADDEADCVVCAYLEPRTPCPRCGQ